jgi:anti-sigma regulatory factor (Ser/Thr protein kinase)
MENFNEIKSKKICEKIFQNAKKKSIRRKNRKRHQRSQRYRIEKEKLRQETEIRKTRSRIRKEMLKEYTYINPDKRLTIENELGLEDANIFDQYYQVANELINADSSDLCINLAKCTRIWPSAIVLLCSLKKWMELSSIVNKIKHPRISSISPNNHTVENYLIHCGFYDYVGRDHPIDRKIFKDDQIVKIQRETSREHIIDREKEFDTLVKNYSVFSDDQYELFTCKIISEILNNVVEHGVTSYDQGWWMLGQYHPKHGLISICIADNGIGFKQNLLSGPQKEEISSLVKDELHNDGDYVKLAFEENVSGSYNAPQKMPKLFSNGYERGARRGHGLKRILATCIPCKTRLTILSHYGYICFNEEGGIIRSGSSKKRIFAGTLYHLNIPAKQGE